MNKQFVIALLILSPLLFACNKANRTKKRLAGTWNIVEYKYSNFSGLTYEYPASGQMSFENCEEDLCHYELNMFSINQGDTIYRNDSGFYVLLEGSENYELYRVNSAGITDTLENGRIILLTKKDLKLEFTDFYQRHLLIMEKN